MAKQLKNNIKEDLRFNIKRANEIVRLAENRRYKFLEINLALVTAFSFLLVYILDIFNDGGKISIITSMIIYFVVTSMNIIYNLKENRTIGISKTICSIRGWKPKYFLKRIDEIDNYDFQKDYKIQIVNLHKYQKNYNKIGKNTRIITLTGLLILITTFSISIIINSLEFTNLNDYLFAKILLYNILASILIGGIVWYLKFYKEENNE